MAGLSFIAKNFDVKEFWWNGVGELGGLKAALDGAGATIKKMDSGVRIPPIGGVEVEVLHPSGGLGLDINDMSLVLKLSYGDKSFLFTGDIGAEAEILLAAAGPGDVTVLKSPHHGSRTSSSNLLLAAGRPSAAVISVGRANAFGFPHEAVLKRYGAAGMEVYRTDLDGAVEVTTDGVGLSITTHARH